MDSKCSSSLSLPFLNLFAKLSEPWAREGNTGGRCRKQCKWKRARRWWRAHDLPIWTSDNHSWRSCPWHRLDQTRGDKLISSTFHSHTFVRSDDDAIYCYQLNAGLLIVSRVQWQIQHDKGGVLQAPQVEAEQIEVWCPAFLAWPRSSRLLKTVTVCEEWGHQFSCLELLFFSKVVLVLPIYRIQDSSRAQQVWNSRAHFCCGALWIICWFFFSPVWMFVFWACLDCGQQRSSRFEILVLWRNGTSMHRKLIKPMHRRNYEMPNFTYICFNKWESSCSFFLPVFTISIHF